MILKNDLWKKELIEKFQSNGLSCTYDNENFMSYPIHAQSIDPKVWHKQTDELLKAHFREFNTQVIDGQQNEPSKTIELMSKIDQIKKIYLIDYINELTTAKIFVLGKKHHFQDFLERNESLKSLFPFMKQNNPQKNKKPFEKNQVYHKVIQSNPIRKLEDNELK